MSSEPKRVKELLAKAEEILKGLEASIESARRLIAESKEILAGSKGQEAGKPPAQGEGNPPLVVE
jgi:hypothetical protein